MKRLLGLITSKTGSIAASIIAWGYCGAARAQATSAGTPTGGIGQYFTNLVGGFTDIPSVVSGGVFLAGAAASAVSIKEVTDHIKDGGRWNDKQTAVMAAIMGGVMMSTPIVLTELQKTGQPASRAVSGPLK